MTFNRLHVLWFLCYEFLHSKHLFLLFFVFFSFPLFYYCTSSYFSVFFPFLYFVFLCFKQALTVPLERLMWIPLFQTCGRSSFPVEPKPLLFLRFSIVSNVAPVCKFVECLFCSSRAVIFCPCCMVWFEWWMNFCRERETFSSWGILYVQLISFPHLIIFSPLIWLTDWFLMRK